MDCALSLMKPVLVVGCTVIDFVTINASFPEEDTDRRCLDGFWQRGGNASNVCTVLRVLGARVEFFGMLSRSDAFRVLVEDMRKRDIELRNCPKTDEDPPFSSVILAKDTGTRTIVHCNKNYPYVTVEDFNKINLSHYGWVHFEARSVLETIKMMRTVLDFNNARKDRIIISLDFETLYNQHLDLCDMCDYVVFSKDLALYKGWKSASAACHKLDSELRLCRSLNLRRPKIVCPWGDEGAGCLDSEKNYYELPAYKPAKIVDTLGAGDCFMAAFIYATYVRQRSLADAVDFANHVASHKITKFGYDHIADLNVNSVAQKMVEGDEHSAIASEDDGITEEERIRRKWLNRRIEREELTQEDIMKIIIEQNKSEESMKTARSENNIQQSADLPLK